MKKRIALGIVFILLLAGVALYLFMPKGPDLAAYEFLKQPRITRMPDQKMLVVTAQGDPNLVGSKAFKLLFSTYFKIPQVPKMVLIAPRARWKGDIKVKLSWTGYYGMPLPKDLTQLPAVNSEPGYKIEFLTWAYGDVAEILHVGPYSEEQPTIEKLHRFIRDKGYKIIGEHEEEYLKGPGMFFQGDPKGYYTIIRYRISKL